MRRFSVLSIIVILLWGSNAKSQSTVLKKFLERIERSESVSYKSITNNETPFGDSKDTMQAYLAINSGKDKDPKFAFKTNHRKDIFNGEVLITLNLNDKTYSIEKDYRLSPYYYNSLQELISAIKTTLKTAPQQIKELPDTIIKSIACYHIILATQDTLINKKHAYTIYHIYLNKRNYLPVYAENLQQGYVEKGGEISDDVFQLIKRNTFSDYKFNVSNFPDINSYKIPSGFKPQSVVHSDPKPLLSSGTPAPYWKLEGTNGQSLSMDNLKDSTVLIDFSSNYCAACILAMPTMDRLREKYKNDPVKFVTINIDASRESVLKFIRKYHVVYPIYFDGKEASEKYNVTAIPVFYLIDKQGKIVTTFDGYNDTLEKDLIRHIDSIK